MCNWDELCHHLDVNKDGEKLSKETVEPKKESDEKQDTKQPPKRNLNGREVPYYEVVMDNGTPCELLQGKPRQSRVIYMCKPDSHNEVNHRLIHDFLLSLGQV